MQLFFIALLNLTLSKVKDAVSLRGQVNITSIKEGQFSRLKICHGLYIIGVYDFCAALFHNLLPHRLKTEGAVGRAGLLVLLRLLGSALCAIADWFCTGRLLLQPADP